MTPSHGTAYGAPGVCVRSRCDSRESTMTCPVCSMVNPEGTRTCMRCGTALTPEAPSYQQYQQPAAPAQPPAPPAQPGYGQQPQYGEPQYGEPQYGQPQYG